MSDTPDLTARAEAFLFAEGGELTRKKLTSLLQCKETELKAALQTLADRLANRGIGLIETDTTVSLAVSREMSPLVQEALKRELDRDIGDAGLEVLAIVLYMGPSTRARVDYIRGVNSSSTLRNLLARGLLERAENPEDAREYLYRPTVELLAHLGVENVNQLPDRATILGELATFEQKSPLDHDRAKPAGNA
ncbi:SMC-Scp complex subunit ScpB [Candidatus Kaiserbacteria bacterium]|nr:SMC-Scp complex subunit ScpB [Candidatus Kaiserbacteria bacterium]